MLVTTSAIVISALKYQDSSLIVKCLTKDLGLKSYLLKGVLKSKKGILRPALFQPFSLLEITANYKKNTTLNYIKEARVYYNHNSIHTDVYKSSIVFFLAEMLSIVIKEEEQNKALFNFIENAIFWLENNHEIANFHLLFMLELTLYLGCYPDGSNKELPYFDMELGQFTENPLTKINTKESEINTLKQLLGINFDSINELKLNAKQRTEFLNFMLDYFAIHLFDFKKPKSIEILSNIFN